MSEVYVIGGGAAGMMAAYSAGLMGHHVTLLEKNEKLGKKIYITGKGRCNFTNACEVEDFFSSVVSNPKFLYSALYTFDNQSMIDFVESHGTKTKVERGNRAFPLSDHASDITRAIARALEEVHVSISLNSKVDDILTEEGKITGLVLSNGKTYKCDAVIIATGGFSYQTTGSTGDGYTFAKRLGHSVTELRPALVPFETKEEDIFSMQGLSLKNVCLTISYNNKRLYSDFGEMLFTHFGVSGPLVLSASSDLGKSLLKYGFLDAAIDLKPALDREQLEKRILRELEENPNKYFSSILPRLIPSKMVDVFVRRLEIPDGLKCNSVTRKMRDDLLDLLKGFSFTIIGTRSFKEAIVTQGGVNVKEVNASTMESKLVEGLYFAGEVLDLDAYTGGYNLQIAWSTGYLAGLSIR